MATMTAETTATKIHFIAHKELAHRVASVVQITDAYQLPGSATETMIASMAAMNHPSIANQKVELVSAISSLAITEIVFREFISVMETMTVSTIQTRMIGINVVSTCYRLIDQPS